VRRLFFALVLTAAAWPPRGARAGSAGSLRFFGYQDGGNDATSLAETAPFTNISVTQGEDGLSGSRLRDRLEAMAPRGVRAMIELTHVLFCSAQTGAYALCPDADVRWSGFLAENSGVLDAAHVACFYVMNEPALNWVPFADLAAAARLVKTSFPGIPTAVVEASVSVDRLWLPAEIDWVGIDEYGLADPGADSRYLEPLAVLKSRMQPGQRVIYVLDGWWTAAIHGAAGLVPAAMAGVARRWYALAASDPDAILLAVYTWPSGEGVLGSADLPDSARAAQIAIGDAITGKSASPRLAARFAPPAPPASAPVSGRSLRGPCGAGGVC
jgi:hypothetical protein